jgi:hypothetical protein
MNTVQLWRAAAILAAAVTLSGPVAAQTTPIVKVTGLICDYTPTLDASGPWQVVGDWSLTLNRASGDVEFVASLSMVRSENPVRSAHTHHVSLSRGHLTALATGYRISGTASVALNGSLAPFTESPIDIEVSGGSAVPFANVAVTFGGAAAAHFGAQPLEGVVTNQR